VNDMVVSIAKRYQCAFDTFERAGYSQTDARRIMLESVRLANEARIRFAAERGRDRGETRIALSLGPFGASLTPSGEFNGIYPPPYGPGGNSAEGDTNNAFEDKSDIESSIDALAHFHFDRLAIFVYDRNIWEMLDYVAFETIPLAREVKAIRRAVSWLQKDLAAQRKGGMKPWWISCTFPDGQFPEVERPGGPRISAREIVQAALGEQRSDPVPTGIGINCTPVDFLPGLLAQVGEEVAELREKGLPKPFLVIYPGGKDLGSKARRQGMVGTGRKSWAEELGCIAKILMKGDIWDGFVIGGCCMTGPDDIRELSQKINT
jgi:homocysteine S-methyltransferase